MRGHSNVFERVLALVREHGLRVGGRKVIQKAARRLYASYEYILLEKTLSPLEEQFEGPANGVTVRDGSVEDVLAVVRVLTRADPVADRKALDRLARGYHCIVGFLDGAPVSQFWWVDARAVDRAGPDLQTQLFGIELVDGDAWCFKFEVVAARRGGGRATEILRRCEAILRESGYRRLYGHIDAANLPAKWVYGISGWRSGRSIRARYFLSLVGIASGSLLVRAGGRHAGTFPYRRVLFRPRSATDAADTHEQMA